MKIHYYAGCKTSSKNITKDLLEVTCSNCHRKIGKIIMEDGYGYLVCSECNLISSPTYPLHDFYLDMYDEKEGYGVCKSCNGKLRLKVDKEILDTQLSEDSFMFNSKRKYNTFDDSKSIYWN